MSALLTTTMPYMGVVVEEMEKRGMRKDTHIMCGGAPLNQEFAGFQLVFLPMDVTLLEVLNWLKSTYVVWIKSVVIDKKNSDKAKKRLVLGCGALVYDLLRLIKQNPLYQKKLICSVYQRAGITHPNNSTRS